MAEDIYKIAEEFKAALAKKESAAASRLVKAYSPIWISLKNQLDDLTAKIEAAKARGEMVDYSWLLRQERYSTLLNQITEQIGRFAEYAAEEIVKEQRAAIKAAQKGAEQILSVSAETAGIEIGFNRLPSEAFESLVGFLGDGSPLRTYMNKYPREARAKVEQALKQGVALGQNPKQIARTMRKILGGNNQKKEKNKGTLDQFLRLSRTEVFRAHREATRRTYQANADIVEGWYWLSALQPRTCVACLALHGTFHTLDEGMKAHVSCRCTQIPGVKGQPPPIGKGADWFASQPTKIQKRILNRPGAYEAYRSGRLRLEDFVGRRDDLQWGSSYEVLGTKRALAGEGKFPGDAKPVTTLPVATLPPEPVPQQVSGPGSGPLATYANTAPQRVQVTINKDTETALKRLFGRAVDKEEIAWAVGALDDAKVRATEMGDGSVYVTIDHPDIDEQERYIKKKGGQIIIDNALFAKSEKAPPGVGIRSFSRQVIGAQRLGVSKIKTYAAGNPTNEDFNGYYTWARFGYNAELPPEIREKLPPDLKSKDIHELFSKTGGPDWWLKNGLGREMEFDLTPGSESEQRLFEYLHKRDQQK